ncbi:kinase-like protein, partial [Microthyrium microscopicum]
YIIGRKIGYGGFSVIKEVTTMGENHEQVVCAVKIVRKQIKGKSDADNERVQTDFEREVDVWRYLKHRYILPLIAVYDTPFATFCITKLNSGGTLFDLIRTRRKESSSIAEAGLPVALARRYIYQLGSAIRYLHEDVRAVHRDIKPENCLLDMSAPNASIEGGNVLLCDFGMADFIHNEHRQTSDAHANIGPSQTSTNIQGSLEYTAPELISQSSPVYSAAADIWAYGCVMYTLLTGRMPFTHEFQPRLVLMIETGAYDREALQTCPAVSESDASAIDLVERCLTLHPDDRASIAEVLQHPWLR